MQAEAQRPWRDQPLRWRPRDRDCRAVLQARRHVAEERVAGTERRVPDLKDRATEAITKLEAIVGILRETIADIEQEEGVAT